MLDEGFDDQVARIPSLAKREEYADMGRIVRHLGQELEIVAKDERLS
jgi:hypothetical protein